MRIRLMKMMLLVGALFAFTLALGAEEVVSVHVPFAFVAGGRSFPAGDYRVNKGEYANAMVIQGAGQSAVFLTMAAEPGAYQSASTVIFQRHGASMFLAAIRIPGEQARVLLPFRASAKAVGIASASPSR